MNTILESSALNLKFEIEVLCKNLALDINDLKPGTLLKDKEKLTNLEEQLSAPKRESKIPEELPVVVTTEFMMCCTRRYRLSPGSNVRCRTEDTGIKHPRV
ncbi:hypothetical protein chiPu_0024282, partial [Chiloscyllium punctatum]|nr:hypothetical protein [Chiloscyllium punctatum]